MKIYNSERTLATNGRMQIPKGYINWVQDGKKKHDNREGAGEIYKARMDTNAQTMEWGGI